MQDLYYNNSVSVSTESINKRNRSLNKSKIVNIKLKKFNLYNLYFIYLEYYYM